MPRHPAAKKNQHNNRHENGLVGPGKRVLKQRSNGQLNGNAKPTTPDEPVPIHDSADSSQNSSYALASAVPSGPDAQSPLVKRRQTLQNQKRDSESSSDGHENQWDRSDGSITPRHRRSDMAQSRNTSYSDLNPGQVVHTILRSCPAGDTVALLIVLLALPSMVLTIIQALFASLTLMPPANMSMVSFLSLFDVFQGSTGSPSMWTVVVVDSICFGLWMCLWGWGQNFVLDLAQIQIAITLGNGSSGKDSKVNLFCFGLVLLQHCVKSQGVRRYVISNLIPSSMPMHPRITEFLDLIPQDHGVSSSMRSISKIKSLFAIHILSQALMAFVRRRVKTSQNGSRSRSSRRADTEATAGSVNNLEPLNVDLANSMAASGTEFSMPPTPGLRETRERTPGTKKRSRQARLVRSKQPFWAALASTKVHVLREVEHKQGQAGLVSDSQHTNDVQSQEFIWITDVEPSSIQFEAICISHSEAQDAESTSTNESRPFFVRINSARWHSVSLEPHESEKGSSDTPTRWVGTISGLAPDCTYTCSFNRSEDEDEFASIMVKTPAIVDGDVPASFVPPPARNSLRPSSPVTTLKNSITNSDSKLVEARGKLNKAKRAHRLAMGRVEKEVENLTARLKSSIDETKHSQKLTQAKRSIVQTEEQMEDIVSQLNALEKIPEDEILEYDEKQAAHEEQSQKLANVNDAFEVAKAGAKNELSGVNQELSSLVSRKDRLTARQAKLSAEHDRITQSNAQDLEKKERRAAELAGQETARQDNEAQSAHSCIALRHDLQQVQGQIATAQREIETFERQHTTYQSSIYHASGPLTPEGNLPGTNPPQPRSFGFPPFQNSGLSTATYPDQQASPFQAYANTLAKTQRPRSNTNQSNGGFSNYSADEDADPIPPTARTASFEPPGLNGRKSSGSSRDRNNGSPAGVIGDGMRSPYRRTQSPGMTVTNTW